MRLSGGNCSANQMVQRRVVDTCRAANIFFFKKMGLSLRLFLLIICAFQLLFLCVVILAGAKEKAVLFQHYSMPDSRCFRSVLGRDENSVEGFEILCGGTRPCGQFENDWNSTCAEYVVLSSKFRVECGAETLECQKKRWPVRITGQCLVDQETIVEIRFGTLVHRVNACGSSGRSRFLGMRCDEGFSNQLMSIASGLVLSHRYNFTFLFPSLLNVRKKMVVTDPTGEALDQTENISNLFDLKKVGSSKRFRIRTAEPTSESGHLSWFQVKLERRDDIRNIESALETFSLFDDIVVDLGNLHLKVVPLECSLHADLLEALKFLVSCFREDIQDAARAITHQMQIMNDEAEYSAIHLRTEEDAAIAWQSVSQKISRSWETRVRAIFPSKAPVYIARGPGRFDDCVSFKCFRKEDFLRHIQVPKWMWKSMDIIAAIDLLVLVNSSVFVGSSFSSFSHTVVSLRDGQSSYEIYQQDETWPFAKSASSVLLFGGATPLPMPECTLERLRAIRGWADRAVTHERLEMVSVTLAKLNATQAHELKMVPVGLALEEGKAATAKEMLDIVRPMVAPKESSLLVFGNVLCRLGQVCTKPMDSPLKLLVVSHSLNSEGAPLVLFDFLKFLLRGLLWKAEQIHVVCFNATDRLRDTPISRGLSKAGVRVEFSDRFSPVGFDIVLINTIEMWWEKHVSRRAGGLDWLQRTIWWVHEYEWKMFGIAVRLLLPRAKSVIFVSKEARRMFPFVKDSKATIIPNSIRPSVAVRAQGAALQSSGWKADKRVSFLQAGTVYEARNQLRFVQAAVNLIQEGKCSFCKFIVVGLSDSNSVYEQSVQRLAEGFGNGQISVLKKVSSSEVLKLIAQADVLVSLHDNESFGMTFLEGMALGKPVIARKTGGVPSVVYPESLDVSLEPGELEEAFSKMLSEEFRSKHSSLALRHVQSFFPVKIRIMQMNVLNRFVSEVMLANADCLTKFSVARNCEAARQMYLIMNEDVARSGVDPWLHFSNFGKNEGRSWYSCDDCNALNDSSF